MVGSTQHMVLAAVAGGGGDQLPLWSLLIIVPVSALGLWLRSRQRNRK